MKIYKNGQIVELSETEQNEMHQMAYDSSLKSVRYQRDIMLREDVDPIVSNPFRWNALTTEQQEAMAQYRQDLLDIPQQEGFPTNVTWPTKPLE